MAELFDAVSTMCKIFLSLIGNIHFKMQARIIYDLFDFLLASYLICPSPNIIYLVEVSSLRPIGPLA